MTTTNHPPAQVCSCIGCANESKALVVDRVLVVQPRHSELVHLLLGQGLARCAPEEVLDVSHADQAVAVHVVQLEQNCFRGCYMCVVPSVFLRKCGMNGKRNDKHCSLVDGLASGWNTASPRQNKRKLMRPSLLGKMSSRRSCSGFSTNSGRLRMSLRLLLHATRKE